MKKITFLAMMALMAIFAFGQKPQRTVKQHLTTVKTTLQQNNRTDALLHRTHAQQLGNSVASQTEPTRPFYQGKNSNQQQNSLLNNLFKKNAPQLHTLAANGEMITTQPEGELKSYTRSGNCYFSEDFITYESTQQIGNLDIVYAPDGNTVYIKEFISALSGMGTWVKGSVSTDGKKISVPTGQNVFYMDDLGTYLTLNMVVYDAASNSFKVDNTVKEITLSVENNLIKLNDTHKHRVVGMVFANENKWACFGDYESVYTLFDDKPVTPPAGIPSVKYILNGVDGYSNPISYSADMIFDGNDVYINGTGGYYCPNTWVKGVKEGNKITIPSGQYLGRMQESYLVYMVSGTIDPGTLNVTVSDMVLEYDSSTGNYNTQQDIILADSKEGNRLYDFFKNLVFVKGPEIEFSKEVIYEQPAGDVKIYQRKGEGYFSDRGSVILTTQDGYIMEVTYAPDNKTVYMKNPLSQVFEETWVKGTIEGNKIKVPVFQCIAYAEAEGYGIITAQVDLVEKQDPNTGENYITYEPNLDVKEFTFTVDEKNGTITLDNLTSENSIYGCIMSDNYMWPGYGDYATVYQPITDTPTSMPANVATSKWAFKYNDGYKDYSLLVNVGIDGNKVYIDNLSTYDPESVICGTLEGNKVTFKSGQFLGIGSDVTLYFTAASAGTKTVSDEYGDYEVPVYKYLPEVVFQLDDQQHIMTAEQGQHIMVYCSDEYAADPELENYMTICLTPEYRKFIEKAAKPATPVINNYDDSFWETFGCGWISMTLRNEDIDGNYIDPAKMAYQLFVKVGTEVSPYTLYADEYKALDKDMDIIPYEFTDETDIMPHGENIALYQTGFDDIGVQVFNYSGGKEMRSDLVWYKAGVDTTGIEAVSNNLQVKRVTYYNLNGIQMSAPCKDISIQTVTYSDGSTRTTKIVR